jgi:hypothetical protein
LTVVAAATVLLLAVTASIVLLTAVTAATYLLTPSAGALVTSGADVIWVLLSSEPGMWSSAGEEAV